MRALILTTKTEHHDYFIKSIHSALEKFWVIYEKKVIRFSFETNHRKIKKRNKFEQKYFKSHVKNKNYKRVLGSSNRKPRPKINNYEYRSNSGLFD